MTFPQRHDLNPGFAALLTDLDLLIVGSITPGEFQARVFKAHADLLVKTADGVEPDPDIYTRLWQATVDYVEDPELRAVPTGDPFPSIGDDELRQAATRAREEFTEILARIGYDQHGRKIPRQHD